MGAGIQAAEIGVAVKDGVVTLSGNVDSYSKKWAAERAAKRVYGVKSVTEEIKVSLPVSLKRTDEDIAQSATNVLNWNFLVPSDRVKVKVRDGWITLSGEVDWYYQKSCGGCRTSHDRGFGSHQRDNYQTARADGESVRGEERNRRRT